MTTEELQAVRRWASGPYYQTRGCEVLALCAEVERLQKAVAEARDIIEHVGFIVVSTEDLAIATKATAWMKENP